MTLEEIVAGTKILADKHNVNMDFKNYKEHGWFQIVLYEGAGLFKKYIVLLSIPLKVPCLRYFENDIAKYFENFEELESFIEQKKEELKKVHFDEYIPNYD